MLTHHIFVVAGLAVILGLLSKIVTQTPVSEPLVALATGAALGPAAIGFLEEPESSSVLLWLSRVLLSFTIMTVVLRYPFRDLRRQAVRVAVLIGVVLPLMVASSAVIASLTLGLGAAASLLVGSIVAPTDPVLASSVVSGEAARRSLTADVRQTLSVEAAANDGIAFAFVVLALVLTGDHSLSWGVLHGIGGLLGAVALGLAVGFAVRWALHWSRRGGFQTDATFLLFTLTYSLFVLSLAHLAGLDGILAVFVAGLVHNQGLDEESRTSQSTVEEGVDRLLFLPVFVLFGTMIPWSAWADLGWHGVAFAVGVVVFRRVPWVVAAKPLLRMSRAEIVRLSWFGPVGVAALFYVTYAIDDGIARSDVWAPVTLVVAMSTVVHGASAFIGRRWSTAPRSATVSSRSDTGARRE